MSGGGEARAVFAVDIDGGGVAEGSNAAASELAKLKAQIEADQKALKELSAQMGAMKGASAVNVADFKRVKESLQAKKDAVAQNASAYTKLGGSMTDLGKKAKDVKGPTLDLDKAKAGKANVDALSSAFGSMPGPVGSAGAAVSRFGSVLANPYLAAGALVAILAVGAVALTAFAVKEADAARSAVVLRNAMMGGEGAGAKFGGSVAQLSREIPLARSELQGLGYEMSKATNYLANNGLKDSNLEHAMGAVGRAQSVLGASAGDKLKAIVEQTKTLKRFTAQALDFEGSGISIDDVAAQLVKSTGATMATAKAAIKAGAVDLKTGLAALDDATKAKLGASAAKMATSLPALATRGHDAMATIFSGINIDPLLGGLSKAVDLVDENTASGKALRQVASTCLQPLVDFATRSLPPMISGFKQTLSTIMLITAAAYDAHTALKRMTLPARQMLDKPVAGDINLGGEAENVKAETAGEKISSYLGSGLIQGLKNQVGPTGEAAGALVDAAIGSMRLRAQTQSPSKLFRVEGRNWGKGTVGGLEDEADNVGRAARKLVVGAQSGMRDAANEGAPVGAGGSAPGAVTNNYAFTFNVTGAEDVERVVRRVFFQIVVPGGGGAAPR